MPPREVPISGGVLKWAREEAGLSHADVALTVGAEPSIVEAWESGEARPTRGQFTKLVQLLERPSAIFFLVDPPLRAGIPTSLRAAPGLAGHPLSKDEVRQIRTARRLQEIASWVLRDQKHKPIGLPRFRLTDRSEQAAASVRELLAIAPADQVAWNNPGEALRTWKAALEALGVLVFQLQIDRGQIGEGKIRGFSAWDDYAPFVAVNTAYHPTARIFTMFHEVGHLITRTDAACFRFILPDDQEAGVERWCERFAAELLLPADALRGLAAQVGVDESRPVRDIETARRLAARFKVSTRAASIRLQETGLAPPTFYRLVERELAAFDWNPRSGSGGGQPGPEKRLRELGQRAPEILLEAADSGRITRSDLSDYLRLTTGQVEDLRTLVAAGG